MNEGGFFVSSFQQRRVATRGLEPTGPVESQPTGPFGWPGRWLQLTAHCAVGVRDVGDLEVVVRGAFKDGRCQHMRDLDAGEVHHPRTDVVRTESDLGHSSLALHSEIDGGASNHAEFVRSDDIAHVIGRRRDRKRALGRLVHHGRALHARDTVAIGVHHVRGLGDGR